MRNPNGYGSVYKLSGNRRKPWTARITVGFKSENGHPIYNFIGYYATRAEAMRALALYNGEVVEDDKKITIEEVFNEWKIEHAPTIKNFKPYESSFAVFEPLFRKPIEKLTIRDYEEIGNKSGRSQNVLKISKSALTHVYAYAFRKGYINEIKAGMPKFIQFSAPDKTEEYQKHRSFTREEVAKLWDHQSEEAVQVILFMIYSGVRITELGALKSNDVHLDEGYFEIRESKTEAGKRKVPIADRIRPIAEAWATREAVYFAPIVPKTSKATVTSSVNNFRQKVFTPSCERILGTAHIPHDTRYTTATFLTEKRADIRHIKLILGHAQQDVTNDVYAKKISVESLRETINLLG